MNPSENNNYLSQDRGSRKEYTQYLEAMDTIAIEKVASASTFFRINKGDILVDVGSASGTSSAILAGLFPQMNVVGIDINSKMVEMASSRWNIPNLSFWIEDGEKLSSFCPKNVGGFFNCSSLHHITSFNGYDNNRAYQALYRQVELLKEGGILVVRDFVKPQEKEILLELSSSAFDNKPSDSELLHSFSQTARSLAPVNERGFPMKEIECPEFGKRWFQLYYTDAVEFIRRKDYYDNWEVELQEEYGYFSQEEFEALFRSLGLRIILSAPIYNPWIIQNRYKNKFRIMDLEKQELGFPPTNYLIAGEKTKKSHQISLLRHLPKDLKPFLILSSYKNRTTGEIYDVVERPDSVVDIVPYFRKENDLAIWIKQGYPRPLATIKDGQPVLDGKHFSGYIPEGITVSKNADMATLLKRFGIKTEMYKKEYPLLNYYTSPGGVNEKVSSVCLEMEDDILQSIPLPAKTTDFSDSGFLQSCSALQLIRTAQTGALAEARLELNVYHLLQMYQIPFPEWLGEKIEVTEATIHPSCQLEELLSEKQQVFEPVKTSDGFLSVRRASFSESGKGGKRSILEYVLPAKSTWNTLLMLPVFRDKQTIWLGLEKRHLPVPQIQSNNSLLLTVPAVRLPETVYDLYTLHHYIQNYSFGDTGVRRYFKLGEKYFPSIGITPEQVYPYVITLQQPSRQLYWIKLEELLKFLSKLEDAHLLICVTRLSHALGINWSYSSK